MIKDNGIQSDKGVPEAVAIQNRRRKQIKTSWADELDEDLNFMELELGQVDEDNLGDDSLRAWDDVKNVELDLEKVRKARMLEMNYVKDRKVYKYASRAEAIRLG